MWNSDDVVHEFWFCFRDPVEWKIKRRPQQQRYVAKHSESSKLLFQLYYRVVSSWLCWQQSTNKIIKTFYNMLSIIMNIPIYKKNTTNNVDRSTSLSWSGKSQGSIYIAEGPASVTDALVKNGHDAVTMAAYVRSWTLNSRKPSRKKGRQFLLMLFLFLILMSILQGALNQLGQAWRVPCWRLPPKSVVYPRNTSRNLNLVVEWSGGWSSSREACMV